MAACTTRCGTTPAVKAARELQRSRRFDVAHHVTFGSVHVPTQLWQLGIPTVFGPVGGGQTAPANMLGYLGKAARGERLRTLFTRALPYSPWHRRAMRRMAAVLAVNRDTVELVRAMGRDDAEQQFDIAIPESFLAPHPRTFFATSAPPRLLWVGRIVARKGLPLALDALAAAKSGATLTIMGESADPDGVRRMIADRGLQGRVQWAGKRLPWAEVRAAYMEHDALLFTSIRETCGAQLLEAMALGLPVITLDLHGAHDLVPEAAGIKVPVTGGASVAGDLAGAIDRYATLPREQRGAMAAAGWAFASRNTWRARAAMAEALYQRICGLEIGSGSMRPRRGRAGPPRCSVSESRPTLRSGAAPARSLRGPRLR